MHIKTSQAHLGAPGKDEFGSLQSVNGSGHIYGSPFY